MSVRGGGGSSEVWCAVWCGGWRGCERRALSPPLLSVGAERRGHAWHTRFPMPWGRGVVWARWARSTHASGWEEERRGEEGQPRPPALGSSGWGARSTHPSGWGEERGGPTADARGVGGRGLLAPAARGHRARRQGRRGERGREGGGVGRTPPRARGRRTHSARAAGAHPGFKGVRNRARRTRGLRKRIFGTKAEPQRIVATRPLCRVQHPVPHSSRLQGIHRGGPVTCDRVRLRPKLGVLAAERPSR